MRAVSISLAFILSTSAALADRPVTQEMRRFGVLCHARHSGR
jgi:hypothetical protein